MIRTDSQLNATERKLTDARKALESAGDIDRQAWADLVALLRCEIEEYRAIKTGVTTTFAINRFDDLGEAVIKARLAREWTQKQLADELGVSEQNVQRDESREYEHASWTRLAEVADALGYELRGLLQPVARSRQVYDATAAALQPTFTTTAFQRVSGTAIQKFGPYAGVTP